MFRKIDQKVLPQIDWELLIYILFIAISGLIVIYSAGFDPETSTSLSFNRQGSALLIGLCMLILSMFLSNKFWEKTAYLFYIVGCGLLIGVLLGGVVAGGARRWFSLAGFQMQPSEFTKLGLILVLAKYCSKSRDADEKYGFIDLIPPVIFVAIPFALILVQPDLGTALCHLLIGGTMLLVVGIRTSTLTFIAGTGLALLFPAWGYLKDYQKQRLLTFLSPEADPLGAGYHAMQSKIAVGSGMLTGKGFMQGTQTQLRFLPEQTTDFIFSVLAEEWGFLGTGFVVTLYVLLIFRLVRHAAVCEDPFGALVSIGVSSMIFWQVVLNIGMVIGICPVVGITLPLFSYGRSSLLTVLISLGIVSGFKLKRSFFSR